MTETVFTAQADFRPKTDIHPHVPEIQEVPKGPVTAVLAPGMGPVRPQLRTRKIEVGKDEIGDQKYKMGRVPVADFERMRAISIAVKEIAVNGFVSSDGVIIPSGRATANPQVVEKAFQERSQASVAELDSLLAKERTAQEQQREAPFQIRDRYLGKPQSQTEVDLIKQTTEADLMEDLITKAVAKPGGQERKAVTQTFLKEQAALNSNQNAIRAINLLDQQVGGIWEGSLAVVTSNFGHIVRSVELLHVLGINNVVGLSAEQVLRHFGYDQTYLDRYESLNVDRKTLTEQERWRRAVQEETGYVLHDVQFFENDERLKQVMGALREHYGAEQLAVYGLEQFERLTGTKIRQRIAERVNRKEIVDKWLKTDIQVDEAAWREEIRLYNDLTEQWLSSPQTAQTPV